jgi:hypothetical protein
MQGPKQKVRSRRRGTSYPLKRTVREHYYDKPWRFQALTCCGEKTMASLSHAEWKCTKGIKVIP